MSPRETSNSRAPIPTAVHQLLDTAPASDHAFCQGQGLNMWFAACAGCWRSQRRTPSCATSTPLLLLAQQTQQITASTTPRFPQPATSTPTRCPSWTPAPAQTQWMTPPSSQALVPLAGKGRCRKLPTLQQGCTDPRMIEPTQRPDHVPVPMQTRFCTVQQLQHPQHSLVLTNTHSINHMRANVMPAQE
jgi:hypothetical protein